MKALIPENLNHIIIVSPRSRFDKVVEILLEENAFHPVKPGEETFKAGEPIPEVRSILMDIEEHISRIEGYYKILGVIPPRPVEREPLKYNNWMEAYMEVSKSVPKTEEVLEKYSGLTLEISSRLNELSRLEEMLEPLRSLDVDLDKLSSLRYFTAFIGIAPSEVADALRKDLSKHGDVVMVVRELSPEESLIAVFAPKTKELVVVPLLEAYRVKPLELPEGLPKNPAKAYQEVRERKKKLLEEHRKLREEIMRILPGSYSTYYLLKTLRDAFKIYDAARMLRLFIHVEGYVPKRVFDRLVKRISRETDNTAMIIARREVKGLREREPTYVEVPWYLKPFHMLTEMYGTPSSKEIVPTIFMAITFPLIYGLMFPDAGHGLLLLLAGYLLLKKYATSEGRRNMGLLLLYVGAASVVTGLLAAEFFGPWTPVSHWLHELYGKPPYASPVSPLAEKIIEGEEITASVSVEVKELLLRVMHLSLALGTLILVFGSFLGVVDAWLGDEKKEALTVRLPRMFVFLFAALPFVLSSSLEKAGSVIAAAAMIGGEPSTLASVVRYGFIASLIALVILEPIVGLIEEGINGFKKGISTTFMEAFDTLLMAIGNTASFLRIMGLALAHSGLMLGFTILALLLNTGPVTLIAAVIVYAFGNLLVAGLEAIIVFAHTLRLHFYEWFSKFYRAGGIRFEPARMWIPIYITS